MFMQLNAQNIQKKQLFKSITTPESKLEWLELKETQRQTKAAFLHTTRELFDLNANDDFKQVNHQSDALGWTHYRLQQTYQNIPIEFSQYLLHEKNGKIHKANGRIISSLNLDPTPQLSDAEALQILLNKVNAEKYAWEEDAMETMFKEVKGKEDATYCPTGELVWIDPTFENEVEQYKLAYKFDVFSIEPYERYYYYVDANTGEILTKISRIHEDNAEGTAQTNYYGTVNIIADHYNNLYRLRETWHGEGIETYSCNNTWAYPYLDIVNSNNEWNSNGDITGCEAHWGTAQTYEYFLGQHQYDSFDNNGAKLISHVNHGVNYVNAFWNGSFMTYGDGNGTSYGPLTSLDVVGHEVTHAITEYSAGLIYQNESGALNESFSDIFGTVIEFAKETDSSEKDWYIGEDFNYTGNGFRSMSDPKDKGDPDTYKGEYWKTGSSDNGGVHTNSGVQNFWFYLLSEGGIGTNDNNLVYNVAGIGMEKAAKIAFRNLTVYLTPNSNYAAARNGAISAATDLYGANSEEVEQVKKAWCAVGVGTCSDEGPEDPTWQVTVTSPNGGENWQTGDVHPITWTVTGDAPTHVRLDYSLNGGTTWKGITSSTPNDGTRNWTIPDVNTNIARMRVSSIDDETIFDISDANFSINPATPPPAPTCDAESLELGPDVYLPANGSITLSTNLEDMAYTFWDFNGSLVGTTASINISNTGLYAVSVIDSCGNTATDSLQVLAANGSTNVWPGDTNHDGVVNNLDIHPIGDHMGEIGVPRNNKDTSWYPHPSPDWQYEQDNSKDVKHVDCNGDGEIDLDDGLAIQVNYEKNHDESSASPSFEEVLSPFQITLQPTNIPDIENDGNTLHLNLILSNTDGGNLAFYSGSFSINYANINGALSNPQISFEDTWLGTPNEDIFYITHNDEDNQILYIGITRLDHINRIGSGKIGSLTLEINQNVLGFSDNILLDLDIQETLILNSEALPLPIASPITSIAFNTETCPYDMVITPNSFLAPITQVANNISTTGNIHIDDDQEMLFKANEVDISPNFSIEIGTSFGVMNEPCNLNAFTPDSNQSINFNLVFEYLVTQTSNIQFEISDSNGNLLHSLDMGFQEAGLQTFTLDDISLDYGTYMGVFIEDTKRHYFSFDY